ncbi:MAG: hypothetical protein A3F16_02430 [Deltaproteobacteria bacterium RIFCSPHIGHO2_12_FULL_43_9]|nr:MAG: hypothetical protein A3F16_02430 [Deltaproteobacteria bacterium RIFCSPHIGHO2_12_FULL_43_9]
MKFKKRFKRKLNEFSDWAKGLNLLPKSSLRRVLTLWFLALALIPMIVIAGVDSFVYGRLLNRELQTRIEDANRGITQDIRQLEITLKEIGLRHSKEPYLKSLIKTRNGEALVQKLENHISNSPFIDRIAAFTKYGGIIAWATSPATRFPFYPDPVFENVIKRGKKTVFLELKPALAKQLDHKNQLIVERIVPGIGFTITCYTKVTIADDRGKQYPLGYLRETILINKDYGKKQLKEKTGLDFAIFDLNGKLLTTTLPLLRSAKYSISNIVPIKDSKTSVDLILKEQPFVMSLSPLLSSNNGKPYAYIGAIVSKVKLRETINSMRIALIVFSLTLIGGIVYLIFLVSTKYLGPLAALANAIRKVKAGEFEQQLVEKGVPPQELNTLIQAFNQMSQSISQTRKALEQKILELNEANTRLKATQAQLVHSAKMVSLGQLVAGVAHELNNPIGYIYSNITHLREDIDRIRKLLDEYEKTEKGLPENIKSTLKSLRKDLDVAYTLNDIDDIINSCLEGALRTKDIVTGLRNFSRLDEAEIKTVDIHEGLENTLKLLSSQFKDRIKVHKDYGKIDAVTCHPSQINQVLMNILTNATQAIKESGDIWITTEQIGDQVFITIKDSGVGIPKESIERIFEPFFTTKPVGGGTGLGLSISYGIIEKHRGEIIVESAVGKGTTFIIRLPIKAA